MSGLRRQLNRAYQALYKSGVARLHRRSGGAVFCYHNVVPDNVAGRLGDPWLHAGVSEFSEQLAWITRSFTVIPLAEMLSRLRQGRAMKGLAALTFDDGYTGAIRHAVPAMRRASVPFAFFPVIRAGDEHRPFWWDLFPNLANDERERYLTTLQGDSDRIAPGNAAATPLPEDALPATWQVLRSVLGDDCTIGVHSVTHRNLAELSGEEIDWELTHARTRLIEETGRTPDVVAYPYGRTSSRIADRAENAGFQAGLGLDFGLVRSGASFFDLPRITVPQGLTMPAFACWASGLKLRG